MTVRLGNAVLAGTPEFKNYTTNRILEIPQNIKLEIEPTTVQWPALILKSGSKVYVSTNGTFNEVTIENDVKGATGLFTDSHARSLFVCYVPSTNSLLTFDRDSGRTVSQDTAPTNFLAGYGLWFDTANNIVKCTQDSGTTWIPCSLPICIGRPGQQNVGWNGYLDQVFNGFGYIGSTLFALPGVKVQAPNGRNEDGTYKNYAITSVPSVLTYTLTSPYFPNGKYAVWLGASGNVLTASKYTTLHYDADYNGIAFVNGGYNPYIQIGEIFVGSSLDIKSFIKFIVDSIANSNMSNISSAGKSFIAGIGMPGNSINITIASSGSPYIAPANGYFSAAYTSTSNSRALVVLLNTTRQINSGDHSYTSNTEIFANIPVQAGDNVVLAYDGGNFSYFKFIYAKGEN